jgi:hypothetical protein
MMLNGYKVIVERPVQKMRLSGKVPVTAEFRAEINAWMAGFFGYCEPMVKRGEAIVMEATNTMILHPADYAEISQEFSNGNRQTERWRCG